MLINVDREVPSSRASPRLLISSLVFLMLHTQVRAQYFIYTLCSNTTNYTIGSQFQINLNRLLYRKLYFDGGDSIFSIATEGSYPDQVYGIFLCRGDVSATTCQKCIDVATDQIVKYCPLSKEAIIWYDECLIRYSNNISLRSTMETSPCICMLNTGNVTEPDMFNRNLGEMFHNLTGQATSIASNRMYAKTEVNISRFATLYGMVQCTPNLLPSQCSDCLAAARTIFPECSRGKLGGRVLTPSCNTRYELYPFLADPPQPPPASANRSDHVPNGKNKTAIITISTTVSASLVIALLAFCTCYCKRKKRTAKENSQQIQLLDFGGERLADDQLSENLSRENQLKSQDFPLIRLDLIRTSTQQFSEENKLGEGGFGPVYKGTLVDGKEIAVKRLSTKSGQGVKEFKAEVTLIARLQHRNLVKLLGCCLEGKELLLVYDYMPNKSLDVFLFGSNKPAQLDWKTRLSIINGIARGILYLHEDSRLRIIHRDLKASNVLLDHEMNPKISDFGMARIFGSNQSEANTNRVVGTYGYMAPEYAMEGIFSVKSDVFSFGVLLLEIVSGRKNSGFHLSGQGYSLLTFAWKLWSEDRGLELVDPLTTESFVEMEVLKCMHIALLCVQEDPADRPTMSSVILMLGSDTMTLPKPTEPAFSVGRVVPNAQPQESNDIIGYSVNEASLSTISPR